MSATIYYDGDCPFCARYVGLVRLSEVVGEVTLVNLREDQAARDALTAEGFDLDQGMVVDHDGTRRGGADAANWIAALSTKNGMFNRLNRAVLGNSAGAAIIYPILRAGRWVTLLAMGREGLAAREAGTTARRTLFAMFFAVFSLFHVLNYALEYGRASGSYDLGALFIAALIVVLRPQSIRALTLLMAVSTVSAVLQAPILSNHTMLRHVVLLAWWAAFGWAAIRGRTVDQMFRAFAPGAMGALVVMYVFGCFHKINTGFLDPVTSCATALWQQMPAPLAAIDGTWMSYLGIYGTFVIEGGILVALFFPRLRHHAVVAGIGFHLMLAASSYAMYISFTTLSVALHVLWLNGEASRRVMDAPVMQRMRDRMRNPLHVAVALFLLAVIVLAGLTGRYTIVAVLGLGMLLPLLYAVVRHGQSEKPVLRAGETAPKIIAVVVAGLFFINCALPYAGLKTAQTMNMFSNLRVEGGVSNHLLVRDTGPFGYLDDVAVLHEADPRLALDSYLDEDRQMGIVYYSLLSQLERLPGAEVSFTLNGVRRDNVSSTELTREIERTLHPRWVRKWFQFKPVILEDAQTCD